MAKPEPAEWSDEWIDALWVSELGDEMCHVTPDSHVYKFARAVAAKAFEEAAERFAPDDIYGYACKEDEREVRRRVAAIRARARELEGK